MPSDPHRCRPWGGTSFCPATEQPQAPARFHNKLFEAYPPPSNEPQPRNAKDSAAHFRTRGSGETARCPSGTFTFSLASRKWSLAVPSGARHIGCAGKHSKHVCGGGQGRGEGSCACSLTNLVKPPLRREDGDQPIVPRRAVPRHFSNTASRTPVPFLENSKLPML